MDGGAAPLSACLQFYESGPSPCKRRKEKNNNNQKKNSNYYLRGTERPKIAMVDLRCYLHGARGRTATAVCSERVHSGQPARTSTPRGKVQSGDGMRCDAARR